MKFISRSDIEARTANPSPEGLRGYSLDKELRNAVRGAAKPLAKRLREYRTERARLVVNVERWNADSYNAKLAEITTRAQNGDAEAIASIESGAVASRQTFAEMHNRCYRELEEFDRNSRALFGEVLPLVGEPMTKAVDKGQQILDHVLEGVGVPRFELTGWRNHISYILLQLEHASRNETADLAWFWESVE
jgi:hypothetical protein